MHWLIFSLVKFENRRMTLFDTRCHKSRSQTNAYIYQMTSCLRAIYCRFRNFRENFIFANSIKRHISEVKNSRIRKDLPISINDRVILTFREGFIFKKFREN